MDGMGLLSLSSLPAQSKTFSFCMPRWLVIGFQPNEAEQSLIPSIIRLFLFQSFFISSIFLLLSILLALILSLFVVGWAPHQKRDWMNERGAQLSRLLSFLSWNGREEGKGARQANRWKRKSQIINNKGRAARLLFLCWGLWGGAHLPQEQSIPQFTHSLLHFLSFALILFCLRSIPLLKSRNEWNKWD